MPLHNPLKGFTIDINTQRYLNTQGNHLAYY